MKKVLITGSNGFIGQNLFFYLSEKKEITITCFTRKNKINELVELLTNIDFVFHLAGTNRSFNKNDFNEDNYQLTKALCEAITVVYRNTGRKISILFTSTIMAKDATHYGKSKLNAENLIKDLQKDLHIETYIFRLPNVFGKWCKPDYNSVVATFCHNIANDLPIEIHDPLAILKLIYIDDLVSIFFKILINDGINSKRKLFFKVEPVYEISIGKLAEIIYSFKQSRTNLILDSVGSGLSRALYSTYVSNLPSNLFSYEIPKYSDSRGFFSEILKTQTCGQFSFFTLNPNKTRGGHYHHTKTEKFIVLKGKALFRFRNVRTNDFFEIITSEKFTRVIETIPGWAHDITNIGTDEMIVALWANEIFEFTKQDTYSYPLID